MLWAQKEMAETRFLGIAHCTLLLINHNPLHSTFADFSKGILNTLCIFQANIEYNYGAAKRYIMYHYTATLEML
jgi:hypothetical protein